MRDSLMETGGISMFQRTNRMSNTINKPSSMFEELHLNTSSRVHDLQAPSMNADLTCSSFNDYNQPGSNNRDFNRT